MRPDPNPSRPFPRSALLVVPRPAPSAVLRDTAGVAIADVAHAWLELTDAGWAVELASPGGAPVVLDALTDPRDPGGLASHDIVSLGFLHAPVGAAMLAHPRALESVAAGEHDALVICGGWAAGLTYPDEAALLRLVADRLAGDRIVAAMGEGVAAVLAACADDGRPVAAGRTLAGPTDEEAALERQWLGAPVAPRRFDAWARSIGARVGTTAPWRPHAVRDGMLITGQNRFSARPVARLVVEAGGR